MMGIDLLVEIHSSKNMGLFYVQKYFFIVVIIIYFWDETMLFS